jgi:DedD protein
MDRQLLERMIGAGVLMFALIIIAPAILDGQKDADSIAYPAGEGGTEEVAPSQPAQLRTHTILLDEERDTPPVARERSVTSIATTGEAPEAGGAAVATGSPSAQAAAEPEPVAEPQSKPVAASTADQKAVQISSSGWAVQLGSFADEANAQRLADEIEQKGFETFLMPLEQSGRTLYRVRVGPRETRDQAVTLAGKLAKAGYSGQVIPQQPDA